MTPKGLKRVRCSQCDYKCANKYNLKMHLKAVHAKIRDQECDQCDFKTSHSHHLRRHVKQVHQKIMPNRSGVFIS